MKTLTLSSYVEDQIDKLESIRADSNERTEQQYLTALEGRRLRRKDTETLLIKSLQNRRPIGIVRHGISLAVQSVSVQPSKPQEAPVSSEEMIFRAGEEGEQLALSALGDWLDDSWTAIRGYKANGGDVDIIAVGPGGIFCIEVKHYNATVSCRGDTWFRVNDHSNRERGQPMEKSPSMQLKKNTRVLSHYIDACGIRTLLKRVIVFTHPNSKIASTINCPVDIVATLESLAPLVFLESGIDELSPHQVNRIISAVRNSHAHWNGESSETPRAATKGNVLSFPIERTGKPTAQRPTAPRPGSANYTRIADMSKENRWIWNPTAFNHLRDRRMSIWTRLLRL